MNEFKTYVHFNLQNLWRPFNQRTLFLTNNKILTWKLAVSSYGNTRKSNSSTSPNFNNSHDTKNPSSASILTDAAALSAIQTDTDANHRTFHLQHSLDFSTRPTLNSLKQFEHCPPGLLNQLSRALASVEHTEDEYIASFNTVLDEPSFQHHFPASFLAHDILDPAFRKRELCARL
jgi:hypothetical protein